MSAKGRPSTWANWVRRVSIWRVRRRAVEWGTEDLLVWSGWMHPYSQTKEVFVSMPFHGLLLQLQEVPFTNESFYLLFGNRAFLLRFNQAVANYIRRGTVTIPKEYLDDTGCIRRVYLPVWVRDAVYFRDHGRCVLCQVDLSGLLSTDRIDHFDHMVALGACGVNDPCNIQLLCESCNLRKGDRTVITGVRYSPWWQE